MTPNHYLSLFTSFSPAQVDLTCVFPAVCLIFDINLRNNHRFSSECQKHLWPYLPHFPYLFIKCPTVNLKKYLISSVHTQKHVNSIICDPVRACACMNTHICARLIHLHSVTPLLVTWSHLSPLSLTHKIYLPYPPLSLPKRCQSHTRLTADIIKAVWPPDVLLAQSRNAD